MTELEKVEKGMECCTNDVSDPYACQECPYLGHKLTRDGCIKPMLLDALALLKEKEPKLLTLEEVEKNEEWMWVEYVSGYCGWQCPDKEDDYLNMVAWNDDTFDRKDYYGKTWRCWTARTTEEQRKAVKWE